MISTEQSKTITETAEAYAISQLSLQKRIDLIAELEEILLASDSIQKSGLYVSPETHEEIIRKANGVLGYILESIRMEERREE